MAAPLRQPGNLRRPAKARALLHQPGGQRGVDAHGAGLAVGDLRDPALEPLRAALTHWPETAFPTVWSGLAAAWGIMPLDAVAGYLWAWAENQVMAALKAVPLGQAAGQRLLAELGMAVPPIAETALTLPESEWSNLTPAFALCCARHETQYSRLFRS